eukprot:gnl/MRDRNA2_/MRDRNA2_111340_c0_seq1.p1 gnl/MRDRNA2_/MRDRNA2_111340_c0~~gnl/MRDRNA2_/MRDRNA2_111340_c0_seq1.p1  ORF type:complete len:362 (+),score=66.67 gnl/MRDRNA2_/MRDRNA2_111340_c0_seq1:99-1184(+)
MAHPMNLVVFAALPLLCAGQNANEQNKTVLDTAGQLLWQSFQPVPSNSTRPIDFTVESTWQERSRRWHVAQDWAQQWLLACWRGFSALILLKAACMLSNMVFQMSPVPLVKSIVKRQDTGDVDAAPLICIAFGCCQWTFYGTFAWWVTEKAGFLVLVYANVMGALLGVVYVMLYHFHCKSKEWWQQLVMYYRVAIAVVIFQLLILFCCPRQQALILVGAIASCCSLLTAVSPLFGLPRVVQLKCSKTIPLPLVLASSVSALLWAACGIQLNDPMITWPNIIAIGANMILLGFAAYYPQEETLPFEDKASEMDKLYKPKEGYEAIQKLDKSFDTTSKESPVTSCKGHLEEPGVIADSSGGTF